MRHRRIPRVWGILTMSRLMQISRRWLLIETAIAGKRGTLRSPRIQRIFWSHQKKRTIWASMATWLDSNLQLQEIRILRAEILIAWRVAVIDCTSRCLTMGLSTALRTPNSTRAIWTPSCRPLSRLLTSCHPSSVIQVSTRKVSTRAKYQRELMTFSKSIKEVSI